MTSPLCELSDNRLIEATLAGNDEAFGLLVNRHKGKVFRLAARFTGDSDELDDVCQEVFIKTYENLKAFRHESPFEHWLAKITVRACHDLLRGKRRTAATPLDKVGFEIKDHAGEARLETKQAQALISWAMARLSAPERLVITLLELEEKTVREIAELTGWSEANVKVRAHRARQALKRILEENHER